MTHLVFGSAAMCIIIMYLLPGWGGGSKGKETRRVFLYYNPGSEDILSWLLHGGAKKCHVSGHKNPIAVPQSPRPVLQDQRIVVSNLCQNTQRQ